ncbi:MAG: permease, partial [Rudaea sp.]
MSTQTRSAPARPGALLTFGPVALAAILWYVAYTLLQPAAEFLVHDLFGLARGSALGDALAFFCYDVPKILLLLSGMIFVITLLRTFFSAERTRRLLGGKRVGVGNVLAAALGIVTPFCSCSAVPLFIGFVESGIPLGVTFSFLIAAPVINEVALVLLFGLFGWQVAALYIASGLSIAIAAGLIIGSLHLEHWVEDFVWQMQVGAADDDSFRLSWPERFQRGRDAVRDIVGKVWLYVVIGIAVGAGIHGYV